MNHLIRIFFAAFFAFSFAGSSVYADEPKESEKIKNKLSEFAEFFYKNPDEELAKDNLQALLESPHFSSFFKKDRAWINRLGYFFGRVGEQFPPIRNYYMIYFDTNPHEQRLLLLDALRLCGDLEVKHYLEQKKVAF